MFCLALLSALTSEGAARYNQSFLCSLLNSDKKLGASMCVFISVRKYSALVLATFCVQEGRRMSGGHQCSAMGELRQLWRNGTAFAVLVE